MENRMNKDYEKRMLIAFIISFVLIGVMWWNSRRNQPAVPVVQTNMVVTVTNSVSALQDERPASPQEVNFRPVNSRTQYFNLNWKDELTMQISSLGGRITALAIDGDWNRYEEPVSLLATNLTLPAGDLALGDTLQLMNYQGRPQYSLKSRTSNSLVLTARLEVRGRPLEIVRSYTLSSNYQITEDISFRNLSSEALNLDLNGRSFTVNSLFEVVSLKEASPQDRLETFYNQNGRKQKSLHIGLIDRLQGRKLEDTLVSEPRWLAMHNNYFLAAVIPQGQGWEGRFKQLYTAKKDTYRQISMSLEQKPFVLDKGESKTFSVKYYAGPRKEDVAKKVDDSLRLLFKWGVVFNWLMKPIEWLIHGGMFLLGKVISNWGIVIILLALIIKLLLSPLSIKAAVSIKRMNLLQPKLKNLQEKYKDDQQKVQAKTMELYKKEGVNPLGGCLPMLLQIPVFFALYRVLSTSVELRGAKFLWIQDLTQPDTLFMISNFHFNLLPLLMTAIQLVQTKLQSTNNPAMAQQNKLNTYMLPVMFLFLFWNMPAGLVLYWTIQNVYTIAEQFIINQDKYVKLK